MVTSASHVAQIPGKIGGHCAFNITFDPGYQFDSGRRQHLLCPAADFYCFSGAECFRYFFLA